MKQETHSSSFAILMSKFGSCVFVTLACATLFSQEQETDDEQSATSEGEDAIVIPIEVEADPIELTVGQNEYTSEIIEATPIGEGNLADLLRLNPAVDFSRDTGLSAGSASLRPAEISIHGQPHYQNLFLIDGTDTTSDLNPASSMDTWSTPSLVQPHTGSSPQGYYVDVELLESIEVFDSNVPAEYGGFIGGVVDAELKRPTEDTFSGSWHYGAQRSDWEEYHLSEDDISVADRYRAVYTPDFSKDNITLSLSTKVTEQTGVTVGFTHRQSTFAQQYEDDTDTIRMIDYQDQIRNLLGRVNTTVNETTDLGISFRYTNRTHDGLTSTTYTGRFEKEHQGLGATLDADIKRDKGDLELKISLDQLTDMLDSESSYFSYHEYLESSGHSRFDGSFGDSNQKQTRFSGQSKFTFHSNEFDRRTNNRYLGGEVRMTTSFYERPEDIVYEQYYCIRDMGREGCQDQDGSGASSAGDEYLNRRFFYHAGKVEVDYQEANVYFEDQNAWEQIELVLGLRGDWNGYLGNFDIAPRTKLVHHSADDNRQITVGLNRYYGRSFLRYELNDAIYGWRESYLNLTRVRGRPGEEVPCSIPDFENCTHLFYNNRSGESDLKTPYSDEFSVGFNYGYRDIFYRLQYVRRHGEDLVSRMRDEDGLYFYSNSGRSKTDSITVAFNQVAPSVIGGSETKLDLSLSYRDTESNYQDDVGYDEQLETELIYYEGNLIPPAELPAWDYNIPFSIGLSSITTFPVTAGWKGTWSNFYNFKRGGTIARDTRENYEDPDTGLEHDIYEDFDFDSLFTIDSRIRFERTTDQLGTIFVRVDIYNLLDKVVDTSLFATRVRHTKGRRFQLEIGGSI